MAPPPLSTTNMATSGSSLFLTVLGIFLISGTLAVDDDVTGLQKIFRLRFIFDEDTGDSPSSETSVILIEKTDGQDLTELHGDQTSLYSGSVNSGDYKLPDSTLTFCFIVVIFYMVYLSLRMFIKPDVETPDTDSVVDTHVLHQLLLSHQFSEAVIPDKLRSLYDDHDQSGVTDLSKVTLIIDPTLGGGDVAGDCPEKVALKDEDELCVFVPIDVDDDEAPPPYPGIIESDAAPAQPPAPAQHQAPQA